MKGRESGMPEEVLWDTFFNPLCILRSLDLTPGSGDVIDFGCGFGTFTVPAARITGSGVIAIDIDPVMVVETMRKAVLAELPNVSAVVRDFVNDGCGLADDHAGYAMLFNILHIDEPVRLLREAWRSLRPGGTLGVIHWRIDIETPRGPSVEIRPTPEQCRAWGEQAGFEFVRFEPLACCSWHWGMVMRKPGIAASGGSPTYPPHETC